MRLKLLTEGRSKPMSEDAAYEFIKKKCINSARAYRAGSHIYRGVFTAGGKPILQLVPKKGKRRESAYAEHNYYNLFIDNLSQWRQYPKRSRSVICSTDYRKAAAYGGTAYTYVVLPVDGSKIAIAPQADIFDSFKKTWAGTGLVNGREFNMLMYRMFHRIYDYNGKADKNWTTLKDAIEFVQQNMEDPKLDPLVQTFYRDLRWVDVSWKGTLMKTFQFLMNPKLNGFDVVKAGGYMPSDREVWTDGVCVMITQEDDLADGIIRSILA